MKNRSTLIWLFGILAISYCFIVVGCATETQSSKPATLKEWGQWSRPRI